MRKDWLNITAKVAAKMHVQKIAFKVAYACLPMRKREWTSHQAEDYLARLWKDKEQSCLRDNHVEEHPKYDVQIIVAAYNMSAYIAECVESILNQQTHYRWHLIVVNDGSTDATAAILEHYVSDERLTVITQPNGGLSAARNRGLQHISARYIMFVDADDRLEQGAIEKLVNRAEKENWDIVEGNHRYFAGDRVLRVSGHKEGDTDLCGMACSKVYRSKIWKHIGFSLGYWYEDTIDWQLIYQMGWRMTSIPDIVYNYRANDAGITRGNNTSPRRIETYWITKHLLEDAHQLGAKPTVSYYETFLRQCVLNTHRVAMLGDRQADYALFVAHRALKEQYFSTLSTGHPVLQVIDRTFRENNFRLYYLYILFFAR